MNSLARPDIENELQVTYFWAIRNLLMGAQAAGFTDESDIDDRIASLAKEFEEKGLVFDDAMFVMTCRKKIKPSRRRGRSRRCKKRTLKL